jgi:microcompartment protein CcmL/EutN
MKQYPAIATLELNDIPLGMQTVDALIKQAPISVIKCGVISQGRYLALIAGSTASIDESYQEGLYRAGTALIDSTFLPDIAPPLYDAIFGQRIAHSGGALAILETDTVSCNIRAAERVLKGTPCELLELRVADALLHGKGLSLFHGELYDAEVALELAATFLEAEQRPFRQRLITAPHESFNAILASSTSFADNSITNLNGELP